ncbi:flagellar hook-length control protein FliK [Flocculibacter collagenilyticus]|uniref:flagellar hook-length control protein FliK n=1 Tax=Flocculibacter collagenilyticus TaxID=2744479 RepID=UPI0018F440B7|nr:flagellar hook-length control protein FliK [Flocculibacter collagenilyticus]
MSISTNHPNQTLSNAASATSISLESGASSTQKIEFGKSYPVEITSTSPNKQSVKILTEPKPVTLQIATSPELSKNIKFAQVIQNPNPSTGNEFILKLSTQPNNLSPSHSQAQSVDIVIPTDVKLKLLSYLPHFNLKHSTLEGLVPLLLSSTKPASSHSDSATIQGTLTLHPNQLLKLNKSITEQLANLLNYKAHSTATSYPAKLVLEAKGNQLNVNILAAPQHKSGNAPINMNFLARNTNEIQHAIHKLSQEGKTAPVSFSLTANHSTKLLNSLAREVVPPNKLLTAELTPSQIKGKLTLNIDTNIQLNLPQQSVSKGLPNLIPKIAPLEKPLPLQLALNEKGGQLSFKVTPLSLSATTSSTVEINLSNKLAAQIIKNAPQAMELNRTANHEQSTVHDPQATNSKSAEINQMLGRTQFKNLPAQLQNQLLHIVQQDLPKEQKLAHVAPEIKQLIFTLLPKYIAHDKTLKQSFLAPKLESFTELKEVTNTIKLQLASLTVTKPSTTAALVSNVMQNLLNYDTGKLFSSETNRHSATSPDSPAKLTDIMQTEPMQTEPMKSNIVTSASVTSTASLPPSLKVENNSLLQTAINLLFLSSKSKTATTLTAPQISTLIRSLAPQLTNLSDGQKKNWAKQLLSHADKSSSLAGSLLNTHSHIRLSQLHTLERQLDQNNLYFVTLPIQYEQGLKEHEILFEQESEKHAKDVKQSTWKITLNMDLSPLGRLLIKGAIIDNHLKLNFFTDEHAVKAKIDTYVEFLEERLLSFDLSVDYTPCVVTQVPETIRTTNAEILNIKV